ncbi:MAG: rod shape-determining protein MreD [Steroidobacteraceae bacterium]|jgi:rod shape-determining protein MreD|nr:rod shape-determining protein MreD [Steroidobacteraceae bacterium]
MNAERTAPRPLLYASSLVALLLSVLPLPQWLAWIRPDFLLLVVVWFALMAPRAGGLLFAFLAGLALDAFRGVVLGQHALAFVVVAYLVHRFHLRMRMFTLFQQSLFVLALLWLYQFLLFWIDGVTGHPVTDWMRWLPVLTGAMLWPVLAGFMGRFLSRA